MRYRHRLKEGLTSCAIFGFIVFAGLDANHLSPERTTGSAFLPSGAAKRPPAPAAPDTLSHYAPLRLQEPLPIAGLKAPVGMRKAYRRAARFDSETLWLARGIFSESKRPEEQVLVAWIIRNRVETRYRGKSSYREVILDPFQFSAFNPQDPQREFYLRLTPDADAPGWQRALRIAAQVRAAGPGQRPFSRRTRHFYSEQSMVGRAHPTWAEGAEPVAPDSAHAVAAERFRFYEGLH